MDSAGNRAKEASKEVEAVAFSDSEEVVKGEADFSASKLERDDVLTRR